MTSSDLSHAGRVRKQLTLYFGGAVFLLLTTQLGRRSLRRRHLSTIPQYYTSSLSPVLRQQQDFKGGIDAFEALNIATMGVMSVGMMMAGGAMYVLDVVNVEEMSRLAKQRYGSHNF